MNLQLHDFIYQKEVMVCEKVPLTKIAEQVGTPCYIYSFKTLVEHLQKLQSALSPLKPLICFSMKSNSNLAVCKALVDHGAGLDIVSGGELYRALKIGANPQRIVFAGVGKSHQEIETALQKKILMFNVESVSELERIQQIAQRKKVKATVALRVNPDIETETHHYIKTGVHTTKFGLDEETVIELFNHRMEYPAVSLVGIHIHIGSQITEASPFIQSVKKAISLVEKLRMIGHELQWLNIGGGLGIIYREEKPLTPQQFADAIVPILKGKGLRIILEPGRFISGNAGVLLTRAQYIKKTSAKCFVIVDASMGDLIRPSLYGAYHEIVPVVQRQGAGYRVQKNQNRELTLPERCTLHPEARVDVVGPVCESGDFLGKDRQLPGVKEGDLLAVMSAGAYGFTMASNYNSRPRPCEVMVRGRRFTVVREREKYSDLIRGERVFNTVLHLNSKVIHSNLPKKK